MGKNTKLLVAATYIYNIYMFICVCAPKNTESMYFYDYIYIWYVQKLWSCNISYMSTEKEYLSYDVTHVDIIWHVHLWKILLTTVCLMRAPPPYESQISHVQLWSLTISREARSCTNCTPVAKCYRIITIIVSYWIKCQDLLVSSFGCDMNFGQWISIQGAKVEACWGTQNELLYKFTSNSLTKHTIQKCIPQTKRIFLPR